MKFKRYDSANEHRSDNYIKYTWYGKKEVPNIVLTLSNKILDSEDEHSIYLDSLTNYFEEYNTKTGWKVVIVLPLMTPQVYELLTQPYKTYYTQAKNFWRNSNTGEDEAFIEPIYRFTNISIKHKLCAKGEPAVWYITLWNDKAEIPQEHEYNKNSGDNG